MNTARTRNVDPDLARLRASLGTLVRDGHEEEVGIVRREMRAIQLEKAIKQAVDAAPPLTAEQRVRLTALLTGGGR